MNETLRNIWGRRSIRKYKQDMIFRDDIKDIIESGRYAPSLKGRQDRYIVALVGHQKVSEFNTLVKEATAAATEPYQKVYAERVLSDAYHVSYGAPLFVIVAVDPETGYPAAEAGAVLENMFIAAKSAYVDSVWINQIAVLSDVPIFRKFLDEMGVPSTYKVYCCGAFGYSAEGQPFAADRKENMVKIVGDYI